MCLPHPQNKIHSANERATGERQKENTQTYKDKFTQTCIHTPQTQIHEQKSLVHHTHTQHSRKSKDINAFGQTTEAATANRIQWGTEANLT